jgi:hypothetical protein
MDMRPFVGAEVTVIEQEWEARAMGRRTYTCWAKMLRARIVDDNGYRDLLVFPTLSCLLCRP